MDELEFFDVNNYADSLPSDLETDCYTTGLKTKGLNLDDADFEGDE